MFTKINYQLRTNFMQPLITMTQPAYSPIIPNTPPQEPRTEDSSFCEEVWNYISSALPCLRNYETESNPPITSRNSFSSIPTSSSKTTISRVASGTIQTPSPVRNRISPVHYSYPTFDSSYSVFKYHV